MKTLFFVSSGRAGVTLCENVYLLLWQVPYRLSLSALNSQSIVTRNYTCPHSGIVLSF